MQKTSRMQNSDFHRIADDVLQWAVERGFKGTDPYDGLNSRLLAPLLEKSRLLRLLVIQTVKKSPINLRPLLMVPPGYNPKGLALFLSGLGIGKEKDQADNTVLMKKLEQMILSLASKPDGSPVFSENRRIRTDITIVEAEKAGVFAWGYNFPWQSRAFLQPAWYPTVVCSSFILDALRDSNSEFYPIVAKKLARFTEDSLNIYRDENGICFSYSPRDNTRVYNASLFAAKILVQAADYEENEEIRDRYRTQASEACNYVSAKQRKNGSWVYGEADHWQWVDNLHTGFLLETLDFISEHLGTDQYNSTIHRGLQYYKVNLFSDQGDAKYFDNCIYPLDPHSYAQSVITFTKMSKTDLSLKVLTRARETLWDGRRKGFIFQKSRYTQNRQIHLRWNQGWMYKALQVFNSKQDMI